jgi:hypothetical protein
MTILTLIFLIHVWTWFFHLLPFLSSMFYIFLIEDFCIFYRFIPIYLVCLCVCVCEWHGFPNFLYRSLLLVYGKATDHCIFIFLTCYFTESVFTSKPHLVESLGWPMYRIISSKNRNNFPSFFQIWKYLLLLSLAYLLQIVFPDCIKQEWRMRAFLSCSWSCRICS